MGRRFIIRTDQRSLKFLMEQREVGPEYQKWMYKILRYDFEIQYKPRPTNKVADVLSRTNPGAMELQLIQSFWSLPMNELDKEIANDLFVQQIRVDITAGKGTHKGYTLENGRLPYKGRIVVP